MDDHFMPSVWQEDRLPEEAADYRACEICTDKSRLIWGEGNPGAPAAILLDNPGAREDKNGAAYVCGTRQTLQTALHRVGIAPEDVYVTYLLKCRPLRRYDKEAVRAFSRPFLERQIRTMQPKLLACLGDAVVQTMFGDPELHAKDLRGSWHALQGLPCMVSYHPLAVRRRPNLESRFLSDLSMLAKRLYGDKI